MKQTPNQLHADSCPFCSKPIPGGFLAHMYCPRRKNNLRDPNAILRAKFRSNLWLKALAAFFALLVAIQLLLWARSSETFAGILAGLLGATALLWFCRKRVKNKPKLLRSANALASIVIA